MDMDMKDDSVEDRGRVPRLGHASFAYWFVPMDAWECVNRIKDRPLTDILIRLNLIANQKCPDLLEKFQSVWTVPQEEPGLESGLEGI